LAKTHSPGKSLTFDELCEEAFGSGLHPWEFYSYDLKEYMQRRKGLAEYNQYRYQEQIIAAMAPYMGKGDRTKVVNDAFRVNGKSESPKETYERIQKRYAGLAIENVQRNKNNNRR